MDVVVVKTGLACKGPFYVFADANVEVVKTKDETSQEVINSLGLELPSGSDAMIKLPAETLS